MNWNPGKEVIADDGSKILPEPRKGKGVFSKESVAKAVLKNISKIKFVANITQHAGWVNADSHFFSGTDLIILQKMDFIFIL